MTKNIRVVHVFWGLGFGGIETMLVNIMNEQVSLGADVHLLLINRLYEESLLSRLNPVVSVHMQNRKLGSKGIGFVWRLNKNLRSINPDKIHLHGPEFYAMIFGRKLRHKVSLTLHDMPASPVKHGSWWGRVKSMLTLGFEDSEQLTPIIPKVFSISQAVKEAFYNKFGVESTVVFNGIQTHKFMQRKQHIIPPPYHVVQISRLDHEKKGQDLLIEAASILKGKLDVTLIGDGESMTYLKELTHSLNADDYVHFLGKLKRSSCDP